MELNERQRTNFVNILVTLGVLFLAVEISSGSFTTRINTISENLGKALLTVMAEKRPNFTELTDNGNYFSDTTFNPKGMAGLYNFTNAFMDLILNKDINPKDFLKIDSHNNLQLGDYQNEWQSLLKKYGGLLAMVIILALVIVFLPLCGLCFCFCRCCGKCGARSQPFDKKHDLCKKIILATLLICLGTLLLFGVVCAFASNQQMQEGVNDLTDNLRKGVTDVNTYLDSTKNQVDVLLEKNYHEFIDVLMKTINESSDIVYQELANYSNATSMTELAQLVSILPDIKEDFTTLKYSTNSLRVYASQLNDAVRKVKRDLLEILQAPACQKIVKCKEINNNISTLQTNIHFNNLPDITENISILDGLINNTTLLEAVKKGKQKLDDIKTTIDDKVKDTLEMAKQKINEAGSAINQGRNNITNVINDLKKQIESNTTPALNTADKYITQYGPYRYYIGLGISCILLLVTLCIILALMCGICGKRPDGYGDDCCNKGTGSQFLICGVMLMFFAGFIIAAVVLVSFLVGTVTQRVACDPLRNPTDSKVFDLIDQLDFSKFYVDFKLSEALDDCYHNKTLYEVFKLKNKFDLDDVKGYLDKFQISSTLGNLDISSINISVTLLSASDKDIIQGLASSRFADLQDFQEFKELLDTKFTTVNLTDLSSELGSLIDQIDNYNEAEDISRQLKVAKLNIEMYQEKIVEPLFQNASNVKDLALKLENSLKLNHNSFSEAINKMLDEIGNAEVFLKEEGNKLLQNTATNFTNGIINQVQTYLDRIVDKTSEQVGKCGPLSLVINATLTSTCDKIVLPWNGFWFGLFWSILVFIPTIIVSVKLGTLYQKHGPYSRDLVEAEYLYDSYVERDNMPLNSRGNKAKKKNKKHKRYEDRPIPSSGGSDMVTREYAAPSNHQDTRYADMAPKQWEDFPAGGPPQYQRAPTEYERPPPYYYPGAGENTQ